MTQEQEGFLEKLISIPAPSGYETEIQNYWTSEMRPFADEISVSPHGNCVATLRGTSEISVAIIGHSDEVGLIANYIDADGFIHFTKIGGVDPNMLASQRVRILTKNGIVNGIVGKTSVHLASKESEGKGVKFKDLWIDIGAKDKKEAEELVEIGDAIIFGEDYTKLQGTRRSARCFDNRIGLYIAAEVLKNVRNNGKIAATIYAVSSVQEETGVYGARNAGYTLQPTIAIAVDVMPSTDSPGVSKDEFGDTKVSAGAVITRGVRSSAKVSRGLIETAKAENIAYQIEVERGFTSTDADPIAESRGGVPIGVVSAPTRYLHTSCEVLDLNDLDSCVALLTKYVQSLTPENILA